jgi:hypothetical protein
MAPKADSSKAPVAFYTVTGEIALSRHEPRVAALEYVAASETDRSPGLLQRATEVTEQCLQPSLTVVVADRWIGADPAALDAHRAAGRASLSLFKIDRSADYYRAVLTTSTLGTGVEFAALETELTSSDNVYGARQLADKLAGDFPASKAALRMQAFAALRADDPAAAVRSFNGHSRLRPRNRLIQRKRSRSTACLRSTSRTSMTRSRMTRSRMWRSCMR